MLMHSHSGHIIHEHATRMYFKNIWDELSYEFGPSCLKNLGRVLCGPTGHGPSWFWAELSVIGTSLLQNRVCAVTGYALVKMPTLNSNKL